MRGTVAVDCSQLWVPVALCCPEAEGERGGGGRWRLREGRERRRGRKGRLTGRLDMTAREGVYLQEHSSPSGLRYITAF